MQEFEFETLSVDKQGAVVSRAVQRASRFSETLPGDILLDLVFIPAGVFQMGSPAYYGFEDERPQHPVSIGPFFMGQFPVTQRQWQAVMGSLPPCRFFGSELPVDRVSWKDARAFCQQLAKKTSRPYRLPTEAEWEYACRAHTASPFSFGPTITTDLANYVGDHTYASEPKGVYRHVSTPRGTFPPNGFGLYDMHGNLWEWCQDGWHDNYIGAPADGSVWEERSTNDRVVRGGSWHEPPNNCRSAVRLKFQETERDDLVGFRIALSPPSYML